MEAKQLIVAAEENCNNLSD